nr:hypothetical protein [Mesorhizobium loti]
MPDSQAEVTAADGAAIIRERKIRALDEALAPVGLMPFLISQKSIEIAGQRHNDLDIICDLRSHNGVVSDAVCDG